MEENLVNTQSINFDNTCCQFGERKKYFIKQKDNQENINYNIDEL